MNLIPHTLAATNLGELTTGSGVNLEVDLLARYVERMLDMGTSDARVSAVISSTQEITRPTFAPAGWSCWSTRRTARTKATC